MNKSWRLLPLLVAFIVAGCAAAANRPQMNANINDIIQTAVTRAQDEWLVCSGVTGTLKKTIEPPERKNWYDPYVPTAYKIEVAGCGRRDIYTVLCPHDGVRCYTFVPGEQVPAPIAPFLPPDDQN